MKIKILKRLILFVTGIISMHSCIDKDLAGLLLPIDRNDSINMFIYDVMNEFYLWYDQVPNVNPTAYSDPNDLLNDLVYKPLDHFSFIISTEQFDELNSGGGNYAFGFYMFWDTNGKLYIAQIYSNSHAYEQGIRRGWEVSKIDGNAISSLTETSFSTLLSPNTQTFTFVSPTGISKTISIEKREIFTDPILKDSVYYQGSDVIGYVVLDNFLDYVTPYFEDVIQRFESKNVNKLIVDVRYNGGGSLYALEDIANMLVPASDVGKTMFTMEYNDLYARLYDTTFFYSSSSTHLNLDNIVFITSDLTYSAGELIISVLSPYVDVKIAGTPSGGKPVGMNGLSFQDILFFPVSFSTYNAVGYGDYFTGIPVDFESKDGFTYDWGNTEEPSLNAAMNYLSGVKSNVSSPEPKKIVGQMKQYGMFVK